jgi:hypothetical protein
MRTKRRLENKSFDIDLEPLIEILGLDEFIRRLGIARVVNQIGDRELLRLMGIERLVANLSAAQRRELKRRLDEA